MFANVSIPSCTLVEILGQVAKHLLHFRRSFITQFFGKRDDVNRRIGVDEISQLDENEAEYQRLTGLARLCVDDADVKVTATGTIAQMYIRKQNIFTEKKTK